MTTNPLEAAERIVAALIPSNSDTKPTVWEFIANDEDYICDGVDSDDLRDLIRAALEVH